MTSPLGRYLKVLQSAPGPWKFLFSWVSLLGDCSQVRHSFFMCSLLYEICQYYHKITWKSSFSLLRCLRIFPLILSSGSMSIGNGVTIILHQEPEDFAGYYFTVRPGNGLMGTIFQVIKKILLGSRKGACWLRALVALVERSNSVLSFQDGGSQPSIIPVPGDSCPCLTSIGVRHPHEA